MKVGFIGAGHRMQEFYLPLIQLFDDIEIVGFWTRSQATAEQAKQTTGICQYDEINILSKLVDMLIICVPTSATNLILDCIKNTSVHLLIETPIVSEEIAKLSYELTDIRIINVAENWPFRPAEQIKNSIVKGGHIGKPNVVVNDFRGYEYHGIAMCRSYFDNPFPTTAVGTSFSFGPVTIISGDAKKTLDENWDVGVLEFENGGRMVHNFNSIHSRAKTRGTRSLRVMCENGCVSSDDLSDLKMWYDVDGIPHEKSVTIINETNNRKTTSISFKDRRFSWTDIMTKDFAILDEQQSSIYSMISAMKDQVAGLKTFKNKVNPAWQGWIDWTCVNALRTSSAWGQKVTLRKPNWLK